MVSASILEGFINNILAILNAWWGWMSYITVAGVGVHLWILGFMVLTAVIAVLYRIIGMPSNLGSESARAFRRNKSDK